MKLCAKCNERERVARAYCRPCKNEIDLKSYHKNQEKRRSYQKEYFSEHPTKLEKAREQTKEWFKENKGYMNTWMKNKRDNEPPFKLNHNLGVLLNQSLKGVHKSSSLLDYIGCNLDELLLHLEKQFIKGMNWSNYGEWHVDHIKPVSSFNFNNPNEIYECWNYNNLQPLWAIDNLKKSNKI